MPSQAIGCLGVYAFGIGHFGVLKIEPIRFLIFEHRFNAEPLTIPTNRGVGLLRGAHNDERFRILCSPGDDDMHQKCAGLGDGNVVIGPRLSLGEILQEFSQLDTGFLIAEIGAAFEAQDALNVIRGVEPFRQRWRGKFSIRDHDQGLCGESRMCLEVRDHRSQHLFPLRQGGIAGSVLHDPIQRNRSTAERHRHHQDIDMPFAFFPTGAIQREHQGWKQHQQGMQDMDEHRQQLNGREVRIREKATNTLLLGDLGSVDIW